MYGLRTDGEEKKKQGSGNRLILSGVPSYMNGDSNNNEPEPIDKTSAAGRKGYEFRRPSAVLV